MAAAYAAAHLHHSLCASPNYPDQMEKALKEAFVTTDEQYEKKGSRDVRGLTSCSFGIINSNILAK